MTLLADQQEAPAAGLPREGLLNDLALADLTLYAGDGSLTLVMVGLGPRVFQTASGPTAGDALLALYAQLGVPVPKLASALHPVSPVRGQHFQITRVLTLDGPVYHARAVSFGRRTRPVHALTPIHALAALLAQQKKGQPWHRLM
jgi:hypothetical protein